MYRTLLYLALIHATSTSVADTARLNDPMRPVLPGASANMPIEQRYRLTATLVSDVRRVAVVNGQSVRAGDVVDDAVVVAVDPTSVELRRGSRTFTVALTRAAPTARPEGEPES